MITRIIKTNIVGQELTVLNETEVLTVEKSVNAVKVEATFSEEWDSLIKTGYFKNQTTGQIHSQLFAEDGSCTVPHEAVDNTGYVYFSVAGTGENIRLTTTKGRFFNRTTVYGGEKSDPTPSEVDQIKLYAQQAKQNAETAQGIAEDIQERADNGEFNGRDGTDGKGIDRIEKVSSVGIEDTYRVYYTDGSTYDYVVTNGTAGGVRETLDLSGTSKTDPYDFSVLSNNTLYDVVKSGYIGKKGDTRKQTLFTGTGSIVGRSGKFFIAYSNIGQYIIDTSTSTDWLEDYVISKTEHDKDIATLQGDIDNKVTKEDGKGLSTNDFTSEYKTKLDNALTKIPIATADTLGGVKLIPATDDMTVKAGIDENGFVKVPASGGNNLVGEVLIADYTHQGNQEIYFSDFDFETGIGTTTEPHGLTKATGAMIVPNDWSLKNVTNNVESVPIEWTLYVSSLFLIPQDETHLKLTEDDKNTIIPVDKENIANGKLDTSKFHFEIPIMFNIINLDSKIKATKIKVAMLGYAFSLKRYRYLSLYTKDSSGNKTLQNYLKYLNLQKGGNMKSGNCIFLQSELRIDATSDYIQYQQQYSLYGRREGSSYLIWDCNFVGQNNTAHGALMSMSSSATDISSIYSIQNYSNDYANLSNGSSIKIYATEGEFADEK